MTKPQPLDLGGGTGATGEAGGVVGPGGEFEAGRIEAAGAWTITISSSIPMLNLNQRVHWAKKAAMTKAWRRLAYVNAMVANLPKGLDHVHLTAHVIKPTARQYDVHNLMPTLKACVDGLVDYGLIPDDTNNHLTGPDLRQGGKGDAAITITITREESL